MIDLILSSLYICIDKKNLEIIMFSKDLIFYQYMNLVHLAWQASMKVSTHFNANTISRVFMNVICIRFSKCTNL